MPEAKLMRLGPLRMEWPHDPPNGACAECGSDCDGEECGLHVAGCIYGGPTEQTAYWLIAEGCPLYHGESEEDA